LAFIETKKNRRNFYVGLLREIPCLEAFIFRLSSPVQSARIPWNLGTACSRTD